MKPTSEQIQAITKEGQALVVEAGAGTGKTWALVQRFLHLLKSHPDWPLAGIVAITFTEKATREMRSRIRAAVEERAASAVSAEDLGDDSRGHWLHRRRELEGLRVSTIHGFCSQLLRDNAIAAGLDPQFTVLDELEASLLKEEAIRQTLANLAEVDDPSLELLAAFRVWDLQQELESLLEKRGSVQELFENMPAPDEQLQRWRAGLAEMRSEIWRDLLHSDTNLNSALIEIRAVPIVDRGDVLASALQYAQEGCRLLEENDLIGAATQWRQIRRVGGRAANWGGTDALRELKELLKSLQLAAKALESRGALRERGSEDEKAVALLHKWRTLWRYLISAYDGLKTERQALDFDDLEILAEELLTRPTRSQRLHDFLSGINHLMVDEFQDTNHRQQRLVYALAHPEESGRLFVVGDAKQSIYRFRQAQVAVFNRTAADIEKVTGERPLTLSCSFRTHRSLLAATNHLFQEIFQPIGKSYADYEARPGPLSSHRPAPPGTTAAPASVEVALIPSKDETNESVNAEEGRKWEAHWMATRMRSLLDDAYLVWDKGVGQYRRFEFGDAAILFRATTNMPIYEEAFQRAGVPYLTVSGRGYYDRPEIRDMVALLTCLYDRSDDLNLVAALRSPLFSLSDETLYRLRWRTIDNNRSSTPIPFASALEQPPPNDQPEVVAFAYSVLSDLWTLSGRVAVWQLLREALDRTGFEATLLLNDQVAGKNSRQYNNIQKFLALAREQGGANLPDFLHRLQDLQLREAREGEAPGGEPDKGSVQLMSIHAAKGLEFPVVFVADISRGQRGRMGSPRLLYDPSYGLVCMARDEKGDWIKPASFDWAAWMDGRMEEAESRRLFYVACTRAADLLLLSGKTGSKGSWLRRLMTAWDIDDKGPDDEILAQEDFSVRIMRLRDRPDELAPVETVPPAPGNKQLLAMPRLAEPVDMSDERVPVSVSQLARSLTRGLGDSAELRPIRLDDEGTERTEHASHFLVGSVVHRALAEWTCLSLLDHQLKALLENYARQAGAAEEVAEKTAEKAIWMIARVQRNPIYVQIDEAHSAQRFYSEVPFTLKTEPVPLYGIVDLIYQDQTGGWHLIDWKTEWIGFDKVDQEIMEPHKYQLAAYTVAMEKALGLRPSASLYFLNPRFRHLSISDDTVDQIWEEILDQKD